MKSLQYPANIYRLYKDIKSLMSTDPEYLLCQ